MKKTILFIVLIVLPCMLSAQNGNYTEVNGVKLYYETYGSGEPLLLLHNYMGTHNDWDQWRDSLAQHYYLIIPDLRGHGKSSVPKENHRIRYMAEDTYALLDELKIKKFKAMGMSGGAMTLIHMATMDTSRVEAMVIISSASYFDKQFRDMVRDWSYEITNEVWRENMRKKHSEEQIKWMANQWNFVATTYDDMNFTPPFLSQIKCPTLIVHGDRDPYFHVNIVLEMYTAIPDAYLWIIPNGNHDPNYLPLWSDQFLKVTKLFLAGRL